MYGYQTNNRPRIPHNRISSVAGALPEKYGIDRRYYRLLNVVYDRTRSNIVNFLDKCGCAHNPSTVSPEDGSHTFQVGLNHFTLIARETVATLNLPDGVEIFNVMAYSLPVLPLRRSNDGILASAVLGAGTVSERQGQGAYRTLNWGPNLMKASGDGQFGFKLEPHANSHLSAVCLLFTDIVLHVNGYDAVPPVPDYAYVIENLHPDNAGAVMLIDDDIPVGMMIIFKCLRGTSLLLALEKPRLRAA